MPKKKVQASSLPKLKATLTHPTKKVGEVFNADLATAKILIQKGYAALCQ